MRFSSMNRVTFSSCTKFVCASIVAVGSCLSSLPAYAQAMPERLPPELLPQELKAARAAAAAAEQRVVAREVEEILAVRRLAAKLVNNFWDAVEKQDVAAYAKMIAARFQGLNLAGVYDRKQQIDGLKMLTVKKFKISHLYAAQYKDTMTISYNFDAKGMGIVSGPSIDVWKKINNQWKLISHSYVPYQ